MIRYLVNDEGLFWKASVVDDIVLVEHGRVGEEPEVSVIDTWDEFQTPPGYSLDRIAEPIFERGFRNAPIPNVAEVIEKAHNAKLPPAIRAFYDQGTYWKYQGGTCAGLKCEVDFVTDDVLGNYDQEHYDNELGAHRSFLPISGCIYDNEPDEQQWIGVDPAESENPKVYSLFTSGEFELAFESFEAFLADITRAED
jgi:hypothetical protein